MARAARWVARLLEQDQHVVAGVVALLVEEDDDAHTVTGAVDLGHELLSRDRRDCAICALSVLPPQFLHADGPQPRQLFRLFALALVSAARSLNCVLALREEYSFELLVCALFDARLPPQVRR